MDDDTLSSEASVDLAAMAEGNDQNEQLFVADVVDDAVVAHPDAQQPSASDQGVRTVGTGILAQIFECIEDAALDRAVQATQGAPGCGAKTDVVGLLGHVADCAAAGAIASRPRS